MRTDRRSKQLTRAARSCTGRYRAFIGAPSCVPFPAFTNAADKATAMQTQAKAARHLVTSIGVVMPSMLHSSAAAAADDDDDDDGSGGGKLSKSAKKKAARALSDDLVAEVAKFELSPGELSINDRARPSNGTAGRPNGNRTAWASTSGSASVHSASAGSCA